MCFSATASFTASALLTPVGLYALRRTYQSDPRYLALAAFPLLFGIQQAIEGGLWLALEGRATLSTSTTALGFLFFAYLLWPIFACRWRIQTSHENSVTCENLISL